MRQKRSWRKTFYATLGVEVFGTCGGFLIGFAYNESGRGNTHIKRRGDGIGRHTGLKIPRGIKTPRVGSTPTLGKKVRDILETL